MGRFYRLLTCAGVALIIAGTIMPSFGAQSQHIFKCRIGKNTASVTALSNRIIYKFETEGKIKLKIVASASSKTVFYRQDQFASTVYQLRFVNRKYSYIVYSMAANPEKGTNAVSGLMVAKGDQKISDLSCTPYAEFVFDFDFRSLPNDLEKYRAMAF